MFEVLNMLNDNIKKIRMNRNISQRELARRINMSGQMISKIERGDTTASLETLYKISEALEVPVSELLDIKEVEKLKDSINSERIKTKFMVSFRSEGFKTLVKSLETDFDEISDVKIYEMISLQATIDLYPLVETMINDKIKKLIKEYSVTFPKTETVK
jgi:transcriptional regulator with XRE-family HTH domain